MIQRDGLILENEPATIKLGEELNWHLSLLVKLLQDAKRPGFSLAVHELVTPALGVLKERRILCSLVKNLKLFLLPHEPIFLCCVELEWKACTLIKVHDAFFVGFVHDYFRWVSLPGPELLLELVVQEGSV